MFGQLRLAKLRLVRQKKRKKKKKKKKPLALRKPYSIRILVIGLISNDQTRYLPVKITVEFPPDRESADRCNPPTDRTLRIDNDNKKKNREKKNDETMARSIRGGKTNGDGPSQEEQQNDEKKKANKQTTPRSKQQRAIERERERLSIHRSRSIYRPFRLRSDGGGRVSGRRPPISNSTATISFLFFSFFFLVDASFLSVFFSYRSVFRFCLKKKNRRRGRRSSFFVVVDFCF